MCKKVAICCKTSQKTLFREIIDKNKVKVIDYIRYDKKLKENGYIHTDDLNIKNYDYILWSAQTNEFFERIKSIYNDRVIDMRDMFTIYSEYFLYKDYYDYLIEPNIYEGLITGLSYMAYGIINSNSLKKKIVNLANNSQDIYFDYKLASLVIDKNVNIKHAIIGLAYYSFDYDLSMSSNRDKSRIYYPLIRNVHNYEKEYEIRKEFLEFETKSNEIFKKKFQKNIFDFFCDERKISITKFSLKEFDSSKMTLKEKREEVIKFNTSFNKNYPKTFIENRKIFKKYLEMLKDRDINISIVIAPMPALIRQNYNKNIKESFYKTINEFKQNYEFEILDFFEDERFEDSDFADITHLNQKGSKKFTSIINKYL